jgi:hypothetical protein
MLSSRANVIIWDKMVSCGANVVMLSFGANVIIWCYVMLSSGMITSPYFIFPENFTHSLVSSKTELSCSVSQFTHSCICEQCRNWERDRAVSFLGDINRIFGTVYRGQCDC